MIEPLAPVLNWFIYTFSVMPLGLKNLVGLSLSLLVITTIFSVVMRIH